MSTPGGSDTYGASPGSNVDSNAGAGNPNSGFNLSKAGLIAIIVVVVVVVVLGIASTVLFVMAKRRQWNVRASIRRASRRLTGRRDPGRGNTTIDRRSKRTAVQLDNRPPAQIGHKRGLVVIKDVEKGSIEAPPKVHATKPPNEWSQRLFAKNWR